MISVGANGLRTALVAGTALTALLTAGTAGIYRTSASSLAVPPYIIMTHMAGGSTNRTQHDEFDQRWLVKCVTKGANAQNTARQISDLIYPLLHNKKPTLANPWGSLDCEHITPVEYEEIVEHENFWHAGGIYRLRAVSTTLYGS